MQAKTSPGVEKTHIAKLRTKMKECQKKSETYFLDLIENNQKGHRLFFPVPSSLFSILQQKILQQVQWLCDGDDQRGCSLRGGASAGNLQGEGGWAHVLRRICGTRLSFTSLGFAPLQRRGKILPKLCVLVCFRLNIPVFSCFRVFSCLETLCFRVFVFWRLRSKHTWWGANATRSNCGQLIAVRGYLLQAYLPDFLHHEHAADI